MVKDKALKSVDFFKGFFLIDWIGWEGEAVREDEGANQKRAI